MQAAFVVEFGQPIPSFTTNTKAVITNRPTNKCCLPAASMKQLLEVWKVPQKVDLSVGGGQHCRHRAGR